MELLSNPTTENPSYTPGSLDLSNGNVILTLTADALAPCTDAIADSFVLNFIDFVEVEAGPDIQSCEDEPIDILGTATNYTSVNWTTSGDGSFSDDTSLQTTYTPGTIDLIYGLRNFNSGGCWNSSMYKPNRFSYGYF